MKESRNNFLRALSMTIFSFVTFLSVAGIFAQVPVGYEQIDAGGWKVYGSKKFLASDIHTAVLKVLNENLNHVASNISNGSLSILKTIPICIELDLKEKYLYTVDYHPSVKWLEEHGFNPQWAGCLVIANAYEFLALDDSKPGCLISSLADGYDDRKFHYDLRGLKPVSEMLKKNQKMIAFLEGDIFPHSDSTDERRLFNNLSVIYLAPKDGNTFTREDLKVFNEDAYQFMKEIWGP